MARSAAQLNLCLYMRDLGFNLKQISAATGIPWSTVWRWVNDPPRLAEEAFCPVCETGSMPQPRYAYLLGLYLGDGSLIGRPRRVFRLEICLDNRYPGIIDDCIEAIAAVKGCGEVGTRRPGGWTVVSSEWKHWPCLFPQHGPGRKHNRRIVLAEWQERIVEDYPDPFLRGLIHSDGWRGENKVRRMLASGEKTYSYPRYQFFNESEDIRGIFCRVCERVGVRWTKMRRNAISVARAGDVALLDEVVGPKR